MKTWRSRLILVAVTLVLAVFVVACSSEGSGSREAFGFLPIPTLPPFPTPTEIEKDDRHNQCPDLPREWCLQPGDVVNVYEALSLDQAVALRVTHDLQVDWVLGEDVQPVLRILNAPVEIEPWGLSQRSLVNVTVIVPPYEDRQFYVSHPAALELFIDVDSGVAGPTVPDTGRVQFDVPENFVVELLASLSTSAATPLPTHTPRPYTPQPSPTLLLVSDNAPFFDHPEEELVWNGPDDRVYSRTRQHCAAPDVLREEFGIPDLILVEDDNGYWAVAAVPPPQGLRWTGYHHEGWEIWQAENPKTIYLLHDDLDNIAFEYENFGCI